MKQAVSQSFDVPTICLLIELYWTKRCLANLRSNCYDIFDLMGCEANFDFCMDELWVPILDAGRNVYDLSMECHSVGVDCYWEEK
jgi:hypothetical protein